MTHSKACTATLHKILTRQVLLLTHTLLNTRSTYPSPMNVQEKNHASVTWILVAKTVMKVHFAKCVATGTIKDFKHAKNARQGLGWQDNWQSPQFCW